MNLVTIYKKHPTQWLGDYLKMQLQVAQFVDKKFGTDKNVSSIASIYSRLGSMGMTGPDIDIDFSGHGDME